MIVEYRESFLRDLRNVKDKSLFDRVQDAIKQVEQSPKPPDVHGLKKLRGSDCYYRIRIADWRCGLRIEGNTVTFVRFLHRKEIYRFFPRS